MRNPAKSELLVERDGTLTVLTLNRPDKLNALSASLIDAIAEAVEQAYQDGIRLLVLRGNGAAFSAGFDLSSLHDQSDADLAVRFIRIEMLMQALLNAPFVTLALVQGACFGAAADLVVTCAQRVASRDATFRMPGLNFGVVLGTRRLAELVGSSSARSILQTSDAVSAQEALWVQFLTEIREPNEWSAVISDAYQSAKKLPGPSLQAMLSETRKRSYDQDLASLVRSVVQPGLRNRIAEYASHRGATGNVKAAER